MFKYFPKANKDTVFKTQFETYTEVQTKIPENRKDT